MKRTLTVNLGGKVFHIDQDAYYLLDKYLNNLQIHFAEDKNKEEILSGFEIQISELFSGYTQVAGDVVTLSLVEKVIRQIGQSDEVLTEEYAGKRKTDASERVKATTRKIKETVSRRLYRNPDGRILGGVAGGLAAYLGWNPSVVRLVWFLLMFFYGVSIPIYFALWLLVPLAHTATEKLQMKGETITLESIGKTVTGSYNEDSDLTSGPDAGDSPKSVLVKIVDFLVSVIGVLVKFIFICISIIFVPVMLFIVGVVVFALGSLIIGNTTALINMAPEIEWDFLDKIPDKLLIPASFCILLVLCIPLLSGIYGIFSYFFKFKPFPPRIKWILIGVWLVAALAVAGFSITWGVWWADMN